MAAMPSDQRFHPLTILFALGGELRNFLFPAVLATITASQGNQAERFLVVFLVPGLVMAVARYFVSTYRYDPTELVIRTGLIFKNERHIPFARIQSLDAVQNVLHRICGVVDIKVQTGTTGEAEATLSVLPLSALDDMRRRVFEGRAAAAEATEPQDAVPVAEVPAPETHSLLRLSLRDRALAGLFDNRGWVLIGAGWGLVAESGLIDRFFGDIEAASWPAFVSILVGLFVIAPVLSLVWALIRLHDFRLTLRAGDLRTEFGALTRITATIPLRRVQAVKIHRGPGHVWTRRASVRVETAGGSATGRASAEREWVAPIIGLDALRPFIATILPEADLDALEWMRVAPRAIRRRRVVAAATSLVIGALAAPFLGLKWAAAVIAIMLVLGLVNAQLYVASLGWAKTDRVVAFKSGWFHRSTIIVPLAKIQAVELDESPFDRRHSMASLSVDTAGAGGHSIDIPYLSRPIAEETRTILAHEAASTVFRW